MTMNKIISVIFCVIFSNLYVWGKDITIKVGETSEVSFNPGYTSGITYSPGTWKSMSSCISIVSQDGWNCVVRGEKDSDGNRVDVLLTYSTISGTSIMYHTHTEYFIVEANEPKSVSLSPSSLSLDKGTGQQLNASVLPNNVPYSLSWSSDNKNIATVNNSGYVSGIGKGETNIRVTTNNNKTDMCRVTVFDTNPTKLTITQFTKLEVYKTLKMEATFDDEYTRSTITWSSSNTTVAEVNSTTGLVKANAPGNVTITAKSANGLSATSTFEVVEPPFTVTATSPELYGTNVDVLTSCSVTFSLPVHASANTTGVSLTGGGEKTNGQWSISGSTLTFKPDKALKPYTQYTLSIQAGTILNQWETSFPAYQVNFTTGALHPMTLACNLPPVFVESGEKAELVASESNAKIYYTLDGSEPTEQSTRYYSPIVIDNNLTLRVRAYLDGYETPEYKGEYKLTSIRVAQRYPSKDDKLYLYKDVNPFVEYTFDVQKGQHFNECKVMTADGRQIEGNFFLNGRHLVFVPDEPLPLGNTYTIFIPEGSVMKSENDQSKSMSWTFVSGMFYHDISAGYDHFYAVRTDNTLYCWGEYVYQANDDFDYGSIFYTNSFIDIATNVKSIDCGMTHSLFSKFDGTMWGRGRQYCGELGNGAEGSVEGAIVNAPMQLQENVTLFTAGAQTTVFLQNGKLSGAGRNDFCQIRGNAGPTRPYTMEMDISVSDIKMLNSGYGNIYALTNGGSLYGWGDNRYGQLLNSQKYLEEQAVLMMEDVETVASSKWREGNVAVIKRDHSLWTWGNNTQGQLGNGTRLDSYVPVKVMDNIIKVAVGDDCMAAIDENNVLWMWGCCNDGRLGLGNVGSATYFSTPQKVMEDVVDVSLGCMCGLALDKDGSIYRWGNFETGKVVGLQYNSPTLFRIGRSSKTMTGVIIVNSNMQLSVNDKAVACACPVPLEANYQTWEWTTSNASIASVDNRGVITGMAEGSAVIMLTSDEGKTAICNVTVSGNTSISEIEKQSVYLDVYNLQGHKIRSKVSTTDGLPKGIYIVNGKKMVVQ